MTNNTARFNEMVKAAHSGVAIEAAAEDKTHKWTSVWWKVSPKKVIRVDYVHGDEYQVEYRHETIRRSA